MKILDIEPIPVWYEPTGQSLQSSAPVVAAKRPAAHSLQTDEPSELL